MLKLIDRINTYKHYEPLLKQLIIKDIKLKYRRSFLGYIWSIMSPLLIMVVMVIVFSNMFRFDIVNYPVYFIIGQTIYNFFSESTNHAMWSIVGNAALLKKTYVPKYIFTLSKISSSFVNTLFALGAMLIVFIVCNIKFNWFMLFIPVILLQVYVLCVGVGLILAQATVFFRDIQYIYGVILMVWMYLTPIFYPLSMLESNLELLFLIKNFNPLYLYIEQFRTIVLQGVFPPVELIANGVAWALLSLVLGTVIFLKTQDKFILYI